MRGGPDRAKILLAHWGPSAGLPCLVVQQLAAILAHGVPPAPPRPSRAKVQQLAPILAQGRPRVGHLAPRSGAAPRPRSRLAHHGATAFQHLASAVDLGGQGPSPGLAGARRGPLAPRSRSPPGSWKSRPRRAALSGPLTPRSRMSPRSWKRALYETPSAGRSALRPGTNGIAFALSTLHRAPVASI